MENSLQILEERSSILPLTKLKHPPSSNKENNLFPPEIDILSTALSSLPFSLLLFSPSLQLIYYIPREKSQRNSASKESINFKEISADFDFSIRS
jgi:hypothetical protein